MGKGSHRWAGELAGCDGLLVSFPSTYKSSLMTEAWTFGFGVTDYFELYLFFCQLIFTGHIFQIRVFHLFMFKFAVFLKTAFGIPVYVKKEVLISTLYVPWVLFWFPFETLFFRQFISFCSL